MRNKISQWLKSRTTIKVMSILISIIAWFSVVQTDNSSVSTTIKDVPINLKLQEEALAQLGLNIIEIDVTTVTAEIKGEYATIWKLNPDQLTATIQLSSSYTEPGDYELVVVPAATTGVGVAEHPYEITGYNPPVVKVKLDRIESRTFTVEANVTGQADVPAGFIRENTETVTPGTITVSGPLAELEKIDSVVVETEINQSLDKTFVATDLPVKLLDAQGVEINTESNHLNLDNSTAQLVISVLREMTIPLSVEFLNAPRNFPIDMLDYTMSNNEVAVAGPVDSADKYKELLLGFVDISQISIQNNVFNFEVELPKGFTNLDNIRTVALSFDSTNWSEGTFNLENVKILNTPTGFDVQLVTDQVYNVLMVGNGNIMKDLTVEDIVVELDLAEKKDLSTGQYQYPVKISAPTKGLVWASGEYNVVIQVSRTS